MRRWKMAFTSVLICFICFSSIITVIDSSRFNLDYTNKLNEANNKSIFRHTCLYAAVNPSTHDASNSEEIISYCLNGWQSEWNMKKNNRDRRFTFTDLQEQNITSHHLYAWFAPIDLIEDYQFFLNERTTLNEKETHIYYNCSFPWFGPMCEYTFDQYESDNLSFADIVHNFYGTLDASKMFTCYEHLQCDRGGPLLCLDWSEICDGNIDCLNGGRDEEHCWQLEITACQNNEYRCLSGQCIDGTLYYDDPDNPDCIDGSDEPFRLTEYAVCSNNEPRLLCEEIRCLIYQDLVGITLNERCDDNRETSIIKIMFSIKSKSTSDLCWSALVCYDKIVVSVGNVSCKELCLNERCKQLIEENCPPLIYLPSIPVLFDHVYFVYKKEHLIDRPFTRAKTPDYVCYTQHLCPELPITIVLESLNNATCRHFSEIPSFHGGFTPSLQFSGIIRRLSNVFWACRSIISTYNSSSLCNMSNMYRCANSSKCISRYRINDGMRDCFYRDDEQQIMTAEQITSLKPSKNWYKCENLSMMISSHLIDSRECYCVGACDNEISNTERNIQTHISFQTICDGFEELRPVPIDDQQETDETECEQWQCNNIYTHCDGIWNCNNGADELNCNRSLSLDCKPDEHVCVSPLTYQFTCLPIIKAYDNVVDCLGGTDEPQLCQKNRMDDFGCRDIFFCVKQPTNCMLLEDLCLGYPDMCYNGDDVNFCTLNTTTMGYDRLCSDRNALIRSDIENYFCDSLGFSKDEIVYFSLDKPIKQNKQIDTIQTKTSLTRSYSKFSEINLLQQHHCYRGINMRVLLDSDKNIITNTCLCPPNYYGDTCQYQNQRVSLTLNLSTVSDSWNTSFAVVVLLIDDDGQIVNLPEQVKQLTYLFVRDCDRKIHLSLLYSTRSKDIEKNYSIHINVYEKKTLDYRSSWSIPVLFSFLPVHRITALLTIPSRDNGIRTCNDTQCINGQCTHYMDNKMNKTFCRCNKGWFGRYCTRTHQHKCSNDSLFIGITATNRSLCVCSLGKFGQRCLLDQPACQNAPCQNGGYCMPIDDNMPSENRFKCICTDGFSGETCEITDSKTIISFEKDLNLPEAILVHLIEVFGDKIPKRTTIYKKVPLIRDSITIHSSHPFHILLVEYFETTNYYLGIIQKTFNRNMTIKQTIDRSHRCRNISELFNETFVKLHLLRRIKYYHLPCQNNSLNLFCFFDDIHMCFCTDHGNQRLANCLEFDRRMKSDCLGHSVCENDAACYYDNSNCPRASLCQCSECFYGARCQFNTKGFALSLDAILGYYIEPYTSILHQPSIIQVSATLTMIMFVIGIINGILCIITFKAKTLHENGCVRYLTCLSIVSPVTMTFFALKFWFLILSQMAIITNRSFLQVQCILLDFILRICLGMDQWFNVCVAIERSITIMQGHNFNKKKSKQIAKRVIFVVIFFTISSVIQEAILRRVIDDNNGDEKRTWCIITYSSTLRIINSIIHIFHVAVPCLINLISAFIIIIALARQRATVHTHQTYRKHLREQFQQHKNLLIAPCVLITLAVPRLVIAFTTGCMKSARNPWLFLVGYLISFIPPLVTFLIFVLPSDTYTKQFLKSYQQYRRAIQRCMNNNL